MASKVTVAVLGGDPEVLDGVEVVADVVEDLGLDGNYTFSVNGEPASEDTPLDDFSYVSIAPSVKGG
jgi:hypothetical protein